jgi:5-methylthioribose kinase
MLITSESELLKYIENQNPHGIKVDTVKRLNGGFGNYVYRLQLKESCKDMGNCSSVIAKHAPPFVAAYPNLPYEATRMNFEILAMGITADPTISLPNCSVPANYSYDEENKVCFLEDVGNAADMKTYISSLEQPLSSDLACEIGEVLGQFIGRLHSAGHARREELLKQLENSQAIAMSKYVVYDQVADVLKRFGKEDPLVQAAAIWGGEQLQTNPQTLCMGDFWPGNILISKDSTRVLNMRIIDWEMCRYAPSGMDLGQFLAESYCLNKYRRSCEEIMTTFLSAYCKEYTPTLYDAKITIIHFGFHLLVWTPRTGWVEDASEIVDIGSQYVRHAWQEDWAWFENTIFSGLLKFLGVSTCAK